MSKIGPFTVTTKGGFVATIDDADPTIHDILGGSFVAPAGTFNVRWNRNGTCRDQGDSANIDPRDPAFIDALNAADDIQEESE